ncbi:acyltransferase family protein [Spirosoma sp.]|uniref:acyltransferase family protein n=1 Tax=Spirosoma sp. TaxID=1899569 RepID=UPI003B3B8C7A
MLKPFRIAELDALRGIAALLVVFFRYTMNQNDFVSSLFHFGSIGIELFFIISGYAIFRTARRTSNAGDFMTGRLARLYPAYWFAVTLYVILLLTFCAVEADTALVVQYLVNLTMLQNFLMQKNIDAVYWILVVVLMFYAVILVLLLAKQLRRIDQIGAFILLLLFIYGAFGAERMGAWPMRIHRFATLVEFFPLFLAGIVFYELKAERPTPMRLGLVAGCYVTQLSLFHLMGERPRFFGTGMYAILLAICFGVFLLYVFENISGIVNETTLFLGSISYSIFLAHNPVDFAVRQTLAWLNEELESWEIITLDIFFLLLVSALIRRLIEKPILRWEKSQRQRQVLAV